VAGSAVCLLHGITEEEEEEEESFNAVDEEKL